jgi:hypothetical protein
VHARPPRFVETRKAMQAPLHQVRVLMLSLAASQTQAIHYFYSGEVVLQDFSLAPQGNCYAREPL